MEGNLTSITDAAGRTETMTYDAASRITSYTSNGGNRVTYDYNKLPIVKMALDVIELSRLTAP